MFTFVNIVESSSSSIESSSLELLHINLPGRKVGDDQEEFISFDYRYDIYIMNELTKVFTPLEFDCRKPYQTIYNLYSNGVSEPTEYEVLYDIYESATISLPRKNFIEIFAIEWYLFEIFSCLLWFYDEYFYYSITVAIMLLLSFIFEVWEFWSEHIGIRKITADEWNILVTRQNEDGDQYEKNVHSSELVPGDLVHLRANIRMPWDAVLLSGSVVVNESVLTGESIPVIKTELPRSTSDIYDPIKDRNYTVYGGTEIIKTNTHYGDKITALVVRTNYDTAKGRLIKNFLFPKQSKYRFEDEVNYYILFCFIVSILLWCWCLPRFIEICDPDEVVDNLLNLITQLVPPALPAAVATGTIFSIQRLKKRKIYCIAPSWVNVAGKVNIMVLDKTGTLTEDACSKFQ